MASEGKSHAKVLAKLAQLSMDKWWCSLAWLAHGFLALAKNTIITLMQAIFLLTFPWGLHLLLSWARLLSQELDHQAPSQHQIHDKCHHLCHLPMKTSSKVRKRRLRDKLTRRERKMPIKVCLLLWASFWLCCTYLKAWWAFLCCLVVTQNVRKKSMRTLWTETERIIENKLMVDMDSPTYLAHFDSDFFYIGIDTLWTWTLSCNKNHFQGLKLYNEKVWQALQEC